MTLVIVLALLVYYLALNAIDEGNLRKVKFIPPSKYLDKCPHVIGLLLILGSDFMFSFLCGFINLDDLSSKLVLGMLNRGHLSLHLTIELIWCLFALVFS